MDQLNWAQLVAASLLGLLVGVFIIGTHYLVGTWMEDRRDRRIRRELAKPAVIIEPRRSEENDGA